MPIDPISIATQGQVTSSGTQGDSITLASKGYIVEITEVTVPAKEVGATAPSIFHTHTGREYDKDEKVKKITIKVTFPDGVQYSSTFVVPPIDVKIGDISINDKERKISFSITPPKTSTIKKQDKVTLLLEEEVTKK